jgi:hypothetical protein
VQRPTDGYQGAIFDVDGVLVDSPHERAWREGLQQLMENEWRDIRDLTAYAPEKFTPDVYQMVMSGKLRLSGARAAPEYLEVPDDGRRAEEYGERKQQVIELIEAGEFESFIPFGVLEKAQALGDGQALREAGRRFIPFHLGKDIVGGIERLLKELS